MDNVSFDGAGRRVFDHNGELQQPNVSQAAALFESSAADREDLAAMLRGGMWANPEEQGQAGMVITLADAQRLIQILETGKADL